MDIVNRITDRGGLKCDECGNGDLYGGNEFIVEYYNTLMDCETMRDVTGPVGLKAIVERMEGQEGEHLVRIDCTVCGNIIYNTSQTKIVFFTYNLAHTPSKPVTLQRAPEGCGS